MAHNMYDFSLRYALSDHWFSPEAIYIKLSS